MTLPINIKTKIDSIVHEGYPVKLIYLFPVGCLVLALPTLLNLTRLFNYQFLFYNELTGSVATGLWSLAWFTLIVIGYLVLIKNSDRLSSKLLTFCILSSVLCFLVTVPFGSTDVFYYLGAARDEILHGINPYLGGFYKVNPFLVTSTSWAGPIMYPPLWLQINKLLWTISQSFGVLGQVYFYKLFFLTCYIITAFIVSKVTTKKMFFIYFLNPLLLFEFATNAHFDALMLLFIALGIYLIVKDRVVLAVTALAVAVLIKYTAVLFFPFIVLYILLNKNKGQYTTAVIYCHKLWETMRIALGLLLATIPAAISVYPYWIKTGPKIFNGISLQSDWFVNSLFSTLYVPIIWLYHSVTNVTIPSISAKYLWIFLIITGLAVLTKYTATKFKISNLKFKIKKFEINDILEITTLLIIVFLTFTQRSYWPWYATWPFLTGVLLGTENRLFRLSLVFTISGFAFYLIYTYFGFNSMQTLDNLQVLYGLVVFLPMLIYLIPTIRKNRYYSCEARAGCKDK